MTPKQSYTNPQTHQDSFDDLLRAMREAEITIPPDFPEFEWDGKTPIFFPNGIRPIDGLEHIAKELRRQGIRFPKALVNAVAFIADIVWAINLTGQLRNWKEILIPFLDANREIFEPVYRTGRFLPPFSLSFDEVSSKMQNLFINMLRNAGIRGDPYEYIYISEQRKGEFGFTNALVLFIPISKHEVHMVALTVRRRRWYIPPSKANENLRQLVRQVQGVRGRPRWHKKKVANETYVLIGRYTRGVRGTFKRKGYSRSKRAVLVFDDRKRSWFVLLLRFLRNLFSKRLSRQEESLGDKKPYGVVAERLRRLRSYLSVLGRALSECEVWGE